MAHWLRASRCRKLVSVQRAILGCGHDLAHPAHGSRWKQALADSKAGIIPLAGRHSPSSAFIRAIEQSGHDNFQRAARR